MEHKTIDTETTTASRAICAAEPPLIRHAEPGEDAEWDRFVLESPSGALFHLSAWGRVVQRVFGHSLYRLIATRGGRISGVFPIARVRNVFFGDSLVSLPLAVYGGICANDWESYSGLLTAGTQLARKLGVGYLEMRNRVEEHASTLPGRKLYVTFTQDLSPGPEKLFQRLPRDTRYAIRKSQKAGLVWTGELSDAEFYDIYARNVHRLGTPVFPRTLFRALHEELPGAVRVYGVRKGKQAIAGVMCFYFRDIVMPYYAGCLAGYHKDSPNNFMYWNLIAQSCQEGIRQFDFGRSKRGTGSYEFKSAWAMVETELPYRYQLIKAKEPPRLSPIDKTFQLPIAMWRRLPFAWTKVLGPAVIRWIPSI